MASILSRLAPLILTLRGSKRRFSTAERTLADVARLQRHPKPFEPPAKLSKTLDIAVRSAHGWPVYEVSPRDSVPTATVLYLHGGCYVFQIDPVHWTVIAKLAAEANVRVVVPVMTLAPDATADETVPAIADLAESLVGAGRLSIVGDSSGGGLALATAMALRDRGLPPLHATVLISPWLDVSGTDPRLAEIAPSDPWLAVPGTHAAGVLYRGDVPEDDWRVSPINGSLSGLGPITMFSGTRDILNADSTRFLPLAATAGLNVDYHEGPGMIHNYPILPMPEGDVARAVIVAAVR